MVIKFAWDKSKELGFAREFIFQTLDRIQYISYEIQDRIIKVFPSELQEHQRLLIDKLEIKLPTCLPSGRKNCSYEFLTF
jgi:hypothetical protein